MGRRDRRINDYEGLRGSKEDRVSPGEVRKRGFSSEAPVVLSAQNQLARFQVLRKWRSALGRRDLDAAVLENADAEEISFGCLGCRHASILPSPRGLPTNRCFRNVASITRKVVSKPHTLMAVFSAQVTIRMLE